jgi:hypothetical protein
MDFSSRDDEWRQLHNYAMFPLFEFMNIEAGDVCIAGPDGSYHSHFNVLDNDEVPTSTHQAC